MTEIQIPRIADEETVELIDAFLSGLEGRVEVQGVIADRHMGLRVAVYGSERPLPLVREADPDQGPEAFDRTRSTRWSSASTGRARPRSSSTGSADVSLERLRRIVTTAVPALFDQIDGGRVPVRSEASLQLHLGRILAIVADLEMTRPRETFAIELEKPLGATGHGRSDRGRLDVWFRLTTDDDRELRCAMELKFFKRSGQAEPVNRYKTMLDVARLEGCGDVADLGYMLVATDHPHYFDWPSYSSDTADFDFRHGRSYAAGSEMAYRTPGSKSASITLSGDYEFSWSPPDRTLRYLLLEVPIGGRAA